MLGVNYKKITQVVCFLVNKYSDGLPKIKLVKLIWAADRYHLRKYARMVTEDDYFAMKNGPVASCVKDVIEFSINEFSNLEEDDLPYIRKYIKNENGRIYAETDTDTDYLSETDIEALNFAVEKFGNMSEQVLVEFTHKYPEWLAQKHQLVPPVGTGTFKAKDIAEIDFFKNPKDMNNDPFIVENDKLNNSREIFLDLI